MSEIIIEALSENITVRRLWKEIQHFRRIGETDKADIVQEVIERILENG